MHAGHGRSRRERVTVNHRFLAGSHQRRRLRQNSYRRPVGDEADRELYDEKQSWIGPPAAVAGAAHTRGRPRRARRPRGDAVGEDVPALNGLSFPPHLERLENEDLLLFLAGPEGWDVPLHSHCNTAAKDWTRIRERMAYVFALFRALHMEESVFREPGIGETL